MNRRFGHQRRYKKRTLTIPVSSTTQSYSACTDEGQQEIGEVGVEAAAAASEPGLWNNRALEICRQNAGPGKEAAFDKRLEKLAQVCTAYWAHSMGP